MGRSITWIVGALGLAVALAAFKGRDKPEAPHLPKEFAKRFASIPASASSIEGRMVRLPEFFIAKWEVSNAEYREFLDDVKSRGDEALLGMVMVDTAGWIRGPIRQEPFVEYYHIHSAYADYPVVNISHTAAQAYCAWFTERMRALGVDGLVCRLPRRDEWIVAGQGGFELRPYAWGFGLRDERGHVRCSYRIIGDERIGTPIGTDSCSLGHTSRLYGGVGLITTRRGRNIPSMKDGSGKDITAPVKSYSPNAYGIHNMNGNVAEMIDSAGVAVGGSWMNTGYDVRTWSTMAYDGPAPWIGFRPVIEIVQP